jgi:hypothetical protein
MSKNPPKHINTHKPSTPNHTCPTHNPPKPHVIGTGFSRTNVVFSQIYPPLRVLSSTWAVILLTATSLIAEIIPPNRTAPWQGNVGVPGGIPTRTTIYKNIVTDLGADPTGQVDAAPIINSAINSCPAGQVVYMPAGTFKIAAPIYPAAKSNFTLRGAGQGQTILHITTNTVPIYSSGVETWPPLTTGQSVSSGATSGSNTVTVADSSVFPVNTLFTLAPTTPVWAHNLGGFPDTNRNMGGMFKVRSTNATTITFDPPCPFDYSGMSPIVIPWPATAPVTGVGYESFTVELADSTAGWAIQFQNAYGCWIYDVEIEHAYTRQTFSDEAVRCEYRHNYIHDAQAAGPNHEGLDFAHASWNLVEDNIFNQGGAPPVIFGDGQGQCIGNVVAYNYITNTTPDFWDISVNHSPHDMLNLIEGNIIQWYKDDGYFGSSSHNTLLRNSIDYQISLKHFSNYYNIVGNVLGTVGLNTVYESSLNGIYEASIYELGYPNIGNTSWSGTLGPTTPPDYHTLPNTLAGCQQLDLNVRNTILRHGNYDVINNAVIWDPNIADHTIPDSLYLTSEPSWWGLSPWPPIGPDLTPMVSQIPAEIRFLAMSTPTPTPTATATPSPTVTPTPTPTATATPTPTPTPIPSPTPTVSPTPTPRPSATPTHGLKRHGHP